MRPPRLLGFRRAGLAPAGYLTLAVVAGVVALATYAIAATVAGHDARGAASRSVIPVQRHQTRPKPPVQHARRSSTTPTPAEFGRLLVEVSNAYAVEHGEVARLAHPDCVQASKGHYMCSYLVRRPHRPGECHLVQAEWTPSRASSFTITLGGRVRKCGTLREALRSLP
jgi:hypothetical protein